MSETFQATRRPRVAFVFARRGRAENSTLYGGFVKRIQKNGGLTSVDTEYFALEELIYEINGDDARIYTPGKKYELAEFDFVYVKSWSSYADRGAALANYLDAKGIPYADTLLAGKGTTKLTTHFRLWKDGVNIIPTLFGSAEQLRFHLSNFTFPCVLKAVNGQKGQDNYLLKSSSDFDALIKTLSGDYMLQPMIPNEGDYRVQVYGYESRLIMKRVGKGDTHLNNTSAGGSATLLNRDEYPEDVCALAEKAAQSMQLEVCGVDVIRDSVTGELYIMEVNQGSQIVTGLFSEENMRAFSEYVEETASTRYIKQARKTKRLGVVGRHTYASLPELHIGSIPAKVDSGAHVSSLHAENIRIVSVNGKDVLEFEIPSTSSKSQKYQVEDFGEINIRNAHGVTKRYTIKTSIVVNGVKAKTKLNLSDRGELKFPLLLGRRFLRGRFLVNVEMSLGSKEKA
jgi:glutathione synthase/RimK-type ligase-like ATP-grasp enzyme